MHSSTCIEINFISLQVGNTVVIKIVITHIGLTNLKSLKTEKFTMQCIINLHKARTATVALFTVSKT